VGEHDDWVALLERREHGGERVCAAGEDDEDHHLTRASVSPGRRVSVQRESASTFELFGGCSGGVGVLCRRTPHRWPLVGRGPTRPRELRASQSPCRTGPRLWAPRRRKESASDWARASHAARKGWNGLVRACQNERRYDRQALEHAFVSVSVPGFWTCYCLSAHRNRLASTCTAGRLPAGAASSGGKGGGKRGTWEEHRRASWCYMHRCFVRADEAVAARAGVA
jgi:hypothetical protein